MSVCVKSFITCWANWGKPPFRMWSEIKLPAVSQRLSQDDSLIRLFQHAWPYNHCLLRGGLWEVFHVSWELVSRRWVISCYTRVKWYVEGVEGWLRHREGISWKEWGVVEGDGILREGGGGGVRWDKRGTLSWRGRVTTGGHFDGGYTTISR